MKSPATFIQGGVEGRPFLVRMPGHFAGTDRWPIAGALVVGIRPRQNLFDLQSWKIGIVSKPSVFGQQTEQSSSPMDPVSIFQECIFDCSPLHAWYADYWAGFFCWPIACTRLMFISPSQNLLDG